MFGVLHDDGLYSVPILELDEQLGRITPGRMERLHDSTRGDTKVSSRYRLHLIFGHEPLIKGDTTQGRHGIGGWVPNHPVPHFYGMLLLDNFKDSALLPNGFKRQVALRHGQD